MILQIKPSDHAKEDIAIQMSWYERQAGEIVAARHEQALRCSFQTLAENPNAGRPRRFRAVELAELKSFAAASPFDKHLIFYRADDSGLMVERVVHGVRDLARRLREPPGSE